MIYLTRLNHAPLVLNSDLIEHIEVTPDTVISMTSGQRLVVLESAEEIIERVKEFRRSILCPLASHAIRTQDSAAGGAGNGGDQRNG